MMANGLSLYKILNGRAIPQVKSPANRVLSPDVVAPDFEGIKFATRKDNGFVINNRKSNPELNFNTSGILAFLRGLPCFPNRYGKVDKLAHIGPRKAGNGVGRFLEPPSVFVLIAPFVLGLFSNKRFGIFDRAGLDAAATGKKEHHGYH